METCCLIMVVAVIGLIIYSISSSVSEKNAEKEKKIKNYKNARKCVFGRIFVEYRLTNQDRKDIIKTRYGTASTQKIKKY